MHQNNKIIKQQFLNKLITNLFLFLFNSFYLLIFFLFLSCYLYKPKIILFVLYCSKHIIIIWLFITKINFIYNTFGFISFISISSINFLFLFLLSLLLVNLYLNIDCLCMSLYYNYYIYIVNISFL